MKVFDRCPETGPGGAGTSVTSAADCVHQRHQQVTIGLQLRGWACDVKPVSVPAKPSRQAGSSKILREIPRVLKWHPGHSGKFRAVCYPSQRAKEVSVMAGTVFAGDIAETFQHPVGAECSAAVAKGLSHSKGQGPERLNGFIQSAAAKRHFRQCPITDTFADLQITIL